MDTETDTREQLILLQNNCANELAHLVSWWANNVVGDGNFSGEINSQGLPQHQAGKGGIYGSRLLWFFSEVAILGRDSLAPESGPTSGLASAKASAQALYQYFSHHFIDPKYGGVVWELHANGELRDGRKQIYAQAFAIYCLSAYYRLTSDEHALAQALTIYELVEEFALDRAYGGYFEAFSREWSELDDIRLSEKDLASPKTMNTHLHLLEAYTGLLRALRQAESPAVQQVATSVQQLLELYVSRVYNSSSRHVHMFMNTHWEDESLAFSYGHDIESSWLLWEAADVLGDDALKQSYRHDVIALAETCLAQARATDGSLYDVFDKQRQLNIPERVWWVQAEAMVGFFNAWQLTGQQKYLDAVFSLWRYLEAEFITLGSEWPWLARSDQGAGYRAYLAGFWKGPYHNGRALMELISRINSVLNSDH